MNPVWIRVKAPFGAFRPLFSGGMGSIRPTTPVISPSSAWGLLHNIAGQDQRGDLSRVQTPLIPKWDMLIAVGMVGSPSVESLFQQIHVVKGSATAEEREQFPHGQKFSITPVHREFLVDVELILGVMAEDEFVDLLRGGIRGEHDDRYGLPFLGDNNYFLEVLEEIPEPPSSTTWYVPSPGNEWVHGAVQLSIWAGRGVWEAKSAVFVPNQAPLPPEKAWIFYSGSE